MRTQTWLASSVIVAAIVEDKRKQRPREPNTTRLLACRLTSIPDAHSSDLAVIFLLIFSAQHSPTQSRAEQSRVEQSRGLVNQATRSIVLVLALNRTDPCCRSRRQTYKRAIRPPKRAQSSPPSALQSTPTIPYTIHHTRQSDFPYGLIRWHQAFRFSILSFIVTLLNPPTNSIARNWLRQ